MKFTNADIGKKIKCVSSKDQYPFESGILCKISSDFWGDQFIGIDIGEDNGLHTCEGTCKDECGLWGYKEDFELF